MRRPIAAITAAAVLACAAFATLAGSATAAPVFSLVEASGGGDDRVAVDISDDGRFVLTRSLLSGPARVVDRVTGTAITLPTAAREPVALSGDGTTVAFTTAQALVASDTDSLRDAYHFDIATSEYRLMSPGQPGEEFIAVGLDSSGSRALYDRIPPGTGLTLAQPYLSDGTVVEELGTSIPTSGGAHGISADGRYVLISKQVCPAGEPPSCLGVRAVFRVDRLLGTLTPVGSDVGGDQLTPFIAAMSADGSCVAFTTLSPRAVWKDCSFSPGSAVQLASAWEYTFSFANLSITADGRTVGWVQATASTGPWPGTPAVPHVHARTDADPAVVLDALDGQLPYGSASGVHVIGPTEAVMNVSLTNLVPGVASGVIARTESSTPPTPPTTSPPATNPPTSGSEAPEPGAGVFTGRTPVRILDTRTGLGVPAGLPASGTSITLPVRGLHGVPAGASAVAVQLTATEGVGVGYLSLVAGGTRPGMTSNLNLDVAGETIANSAVVPIGADGSITLYTNAPSHAIVDLAGWWTPATVATGAGRFQAVGPVRALDTRPGSRVAHDGPKPAAGSTTHVQITGRLGVPTTGVAAVVLNVTIAEPEALGFVQAAPAATLQPGASSTVNVGRPGQVIAASTIVPVDALGRIALYAQPSTHLVVDIAGYFTDESASPGIDGMFVPYTGTNPRALDTRPGAGWLGTKPTAGQRIDLTPTGSYQAVVGNVAAVDTDGPGFVQLGPAATMVDGSTSNLNPTGVGETVANAFIAPVDGADLGVFTLAGTHLIVDVVGHMTR